MDFRFQAEYFMGNLKAKCEETIFTELRQKINEFLSIVEGLQWRPKRPEIKPHDFVEDLVLFLRSTIVELGRWNPYLARMCYLTTF